MKFDHDLKEKKNKNLPTGFEPATSTSLGNRLSTKLFRQFVKMESLKFGQNSNEKRKQIMIASEFEPATQDH